MLELVVNLEKKFYLKALQYFKLMNVESVFMWTIPLPENQSAWLTLSFCLTH